MSLAKRLQGQQTIDLKQNWITGIKEQKGAGRPEKSKYAELKNTVHREVIESIEEENQLELQGEEL